jgi:hypothetical protein
MPRRPPKKPDPALDLTWHLLALSALPCPLTPAALFPAAPNAAVELEGKSFSAVANQWLERATGGGE